MKRAFFVAVVISILLLSLPGTFNVSIRNALSQKFLLVSSLFHTKEPKIRDETVETWKRAQDKREQKQKQFLSHFAPSSQYLVGKVIFRAENSWNSCLWIDLGTDDNPETGPKIVAKNSPVLSGDSVVGVLDYVGKKESLVRLISDSGLTPSVRVARRLYDPSLIAAIETIEANKELLQDEQEQKALSFLLSRFTSKNSVPKDTEYLAKGILQGYGDPMWRSTGNLLKGIGFTYDFPDAHGPARELRTGQPIGDLAQASPIALVEVGDLLITSGMDGIFPEGLKIARVEAIHPLEEGAYAYELTARPTAHNLMALEYVTILPSQNFDPALLPDRVERIIQQLE